MGRAKGLTTERCHKRRIVIANQVRNGQTAAEVAQMHGVGLNLVYQACSIHKARLPRSVQSIRGAFRIVRLLDPPNRTRETIATLCGVNVNWVSQIDVWAVEAGILLPRKDRG